MMSNGKRSNEGCWTCRVRRKKCDEKRPACLTCTSLQLHCHGYGPKPAWMDRGPMERGMAQSLRHAVKQHSHRNKHRNFNHSPQEHSESAPSDSPSELPTIEQMSSPSSSLTPLNSVYLRSSGAQADGFSEERTFSRDSSAPPSDSISSASTVHHRPNNIGVHETRVSDSNSYSNFGLPSPYSANSGIETPKETPNAVQIETLYSAFSSDYKEDQSTLLMHFLDQVFPIQFPFHNPSILEGGRGWLLSILVQNRPLYSAALSLAAYHQQSVLCRATGTVCTSRVEELQERHIASIQELRRHLEVFSNPDRANSLTDNIEVLACISLLISLELFRGDTYNWRMHLQAASALFPTLQNVCDTDGTKFLPHAYRSALFFFIGVIAWYEILSCATTGMKPSLGEDCRDSSSPTSVNLDKIMGTENWVMFLIMDIAFLNDWKTTAEANGSLSMRELVRRGAQMEEGLEEGLAKLSRENTTLEVHSQSSRYTLWEKKHNYDVREITRIFACAALVYLNVVVSGPHPEIPEIRQSVCRTAAAIESLSRTDLVGNLTWPVCIAGCMAVKEQQPFFRNLITEAGVDVSPFGNPSKALMVMEECWRMRGLQDGSSHGVDWQMATKSLGLDVLLV